MVAISTYTLRRLDYSDKPFKWWGLSGLLDTRVIEVQRRTQSYVSYGTSLRMNIHFSRRSLSLRVFLLHHLLLVVVCDNPITKMAKPPKNGAPLRQPLPSTRCPHWNQGHLCCFECLQCNSSVDCSVFEVHRSHSFLGQIAVPAHLTKWFNMLVAVKQQTKDPNMGDVTVLYPYIPSPWRALWGGPLSRTKYSLLNLGEKGLLEAHNEFPLADLMALEPLEWYWSLRVTPNSVMDLEDGSSPLWKMPEMAPSPVCTRER